jgi:H+/Cl- antiporter ClcA
VAKILLWLIAVITNFCYFHTFSTTYVGPQHSHLGWTSALIPIVGGIATGLMARYGSEKIRGHGIPEALEAILIGRSRIEPKIAILKPVSSAIAIGTGGPFGAEGPIIMTGGACGSLFAQFFHLSPAERKTLLVAGAAGGMAAVFATPIAAVLLAVELLLFEWKPRSFIPVAISSIVAAVLRVPLLGAGPIFGVTPHAVATPQEFGYAVIVGIIAGFGATLLTWLVYALEDLFRKLPIHWMWWPAIGGIAVGVGGLICPDVLGVGYETIHHLLSGQLLGPMLIGLFIAKALVWSTALGSGTSGGVLAPLLMIGGAVGAYEAHWIPAGDTGLWAMVSMAAIMGGTMRAPFTATIFMLELTHDLNAVPTVFVGSVAAVAVTVLVLKRSILTEKVARRGYHIMREYSVDPFDMARVGSVMDAEIAAIPAGTIVSELAARIAARDPDVTRHHAIPIVDEGGKLAGIITQGDVMRAMDTDKGRSMNVLAAGSTMPVTAFADELIQDAITRMLKQNVGRLIVVDREDPLHIIGYLGRPGILEARLHHLQEEHSREPGWIGRRMRAGQGS